MKNMKFSYLAAIFVLIFLFTKSNAQPKWTAGDKYFLNQGNPQFLNGINYVPSYNWVLMLDKWDEKQVDADIKKFSEMGIKCVRFIPLWHLTQPQPNKLDETIMKRIGIMLDLGLKYGVSFQLAPITGWMTGGAFLPDWAMGNIFTDKKIIDGEKFLAFEFAKRFGSHPALQSLDFGNGINTLVGAMKLKVTSKEIDDWMATIYKAFKDGNKDCLVTNGIGAGWDERFHIEAISKSADYMAVQCFPKAQGLLPYDSQMGLRSLYSCNFLVEWAAMVGKPVLVQEIGISTNAMASFQCYAYLQINFISSWAEGAAGYFWWGSHNIPEDYIIVTPALRPEFSTNRMKKGLMIGDKGMGVLSEDNKITPFGKAYAESSKWIDKLGIGWDDKLPLCYIIVPHTTNFHEAMLQFITPFIIAKQAHFNVKISWEDKPIPTNADCVIIPGFSLSQLGKDNIGTYLTNGGSVYQSFYNDFATNIKLSDTVVTLPKQVLYTNSREGDLFGRNSFTLYDVAYKKFSSDKTTKLANYTDLKISPSTFQEAYVKTSIGKGNYYFLSTNMEESVRNSFNPWDKDESYKVYAALKPESKIYMENKFIELFHKMRADQEILVLINHDDRFQDAIIYSNDDITLADYFTNNDKQNGTMINYRMKPYEVKVLKINR